MEFYKKWIHSLKNVQKSILIRLVYNAVRNKMDTFESLKWLMNFDWSWCKCESTRINTVFHENAKFRLNGPTKRGRSIMACGESKTIMKGHFSQFERSISKTVQLWYFRRSGFSHFGRSHVDFGSIFSRMYSILWTVHFHLQESRTFHFDPRSATSDSTLSKLTFSVLLRVETVNSKILQSQILESFCILKSFWILKPNTIQNTICYVPLREITWIKLQFKSRYTIWL